MKKEQANNLRVHVLQIAFSFIERISPNNVIISLQDEEQIVSDAVANHHLIELLSTINSSVFSHYIRSLFQWLSDEENGYSNHPFALDAYSKFCLKSDQNTKLFENSISNQQLTDGSIPIYTALVSGGDFFSTLWATKILINYDRQYFGETIECAFDYLIDKGEIAARTNSQLGFLLFILIKYSNEKYQKIIDELFEKIYELAKSIKFEGNVLECVNDLYIIEDILEYGEYRNHKDVKNLIAEKLILLFSLDKEPELPEVFKRFSNLLPQSPYFQFMLKAGLIGQRFLQYGNHSNIDIDLNNELHLNYRKIKYLGQQNERSLAYYKEHFGSIQKEFSKYDDKLKEIWEKSDSTYEQSIFMMMPFRSNINFRTLTKEIKKACEYYGFKAFRVDDKGRSPYDTLWDNIVLNMLSCKYGISVYVSDKSIDKMTDELRFFENPNVALEFGFMKSRGKKVLVLKEQESKPPSDLQGFVWEPFDIENPDISIPKALEKWLSELKLDNTPHNST